MTLLLALGGAGVCVFGVTLVADALATLRRRGALDPNFWASMGEYRRYRLRALRPVGKGLLGLLVTGGGAFVVYFGITSFYLGSLGRIGR